MDKRYAAKNVKINNSKKIQCKKLDVDCNGFRTKWETYLGFMNPNFFCIISFLKYHMSHYLYAHEVVLTYTKGLPHGPAIAGPF